jgi:transposase-like protein
MSKSPKKWSPETKLKIALEAIKGDKSLTEIASETGLHPKQIRRWRDQLLAEGQEIFIHKTTLKKADPDKEKLLSIIEQLNLELDFLKKKLMRNN